MSLLNRLDSILEDFTSVIRTAPGYKEVANEILVDNVTAVLDSYAYIAGEPLNGTLCRTRSLFITLVELDWTQHGPISTIFTSYTCSTITWYNSVTAIPSHSQNNGTMKTSIRGIYILKVNEHKQVTTIYHEQNSAAQLYALYPSPNTRPDCKKDWRPINGVEGTERSEGRCGEACY